MVDIPYHTHTFDIPTASEGEIRTGIEAGKSITPDKLFPVLADKADKATTLAGYGIVDAATKDQGEKASTAVQPEQVSAVGFSGRYNDLLNKPDLGGSSGLNVGTTAGTVAAGDDSRIVNAVQKATTVTAGAGLAGGGTLAANIALALSSTSLASLALADTAVQPARKFTVGTGLTGGGDFSADRSVALNAASIGSLALADSAVQPARAIAAGSGLSGGGDLSANRSISLNPATIASLVLADNAVPNVRTVTAGTGLTGGGALNANITLGLNASSVASLARADSAVQPAGIAGFATKTELTTGLGAKLDSGAQAVDSAKLQGYTTATLPISTATQTALNGKATTADGALARTAIQPSDLGALARKDTIATTDITATGSTAGGALLTRGGAWVDPTGGGDMFRAVYDPNNKAVDVFSMANMIEAPDALKLTDAERVAITANTTARHNHSNKAVLDATTASFLTAEKTKLGGIAAGATANTGTVTSVAVAVPTGFASTAAITTSGTITIGYATGYQAYTTAEAQKLSGIDLSLYQALSQKNAANGYAGLGVDGKILITMLPDAVLGAMRFTGFWNAATNSPAIPAAAPANNGWYYIVQVAGATSQGGITDWEVGDWIVSNGTSWGKIDNTDAVVSVAGLKGAISTADLKAALALNLVDNTSDVNKQVSTPQAAADALRVLKSGDNGLGFFESVFKPYAATGATLKPPKSASNYQIYGNSGNFTLQAPDNGTYTMFIIIWPEAGSGAMTATGFSSPPKGTFNPSTVNVLTIRVLDVNKYLSIEAMP